MLKWVLIAIGALLLTLAGIMVMQIGPRNVIGMLRYDTRHEGALKPGVPAPDLVLVALDGTSRVPMLRHPHGRPLILIFGSFT